MPEEFYNIFGTNDNGQPNSTINPMIESEPTYAIAENHGFLGFDVGAGGSGWWSLI